MTFLRKLTTITSASTLFLTVLVASPTSADSHTPTQVADSVAGASGSSPYSGVVFNGKYYFNAYDPVNHYELRVFDGTNPPSLVQDIRSGASSANPAELTVFGDKLYFRADNGTNGNELWVYDGTNPASMVKDIYVGANAGNPEQLTVFDDRLYFRADNGTNGRELWVYDGTNPASMVQDIYGGSSSSMPQYLTVFNNKLYFQANDGTNGYELWVYDGTNPASMVQDIRLGANSSTPKDLTVFGGKLYFAATDGTNGVEPWVFDGTSATGFDINTAGSSIEDDWIMGVNPHFAATSMGLFFRATDGATGFELWTIAPAPAPAPAAPAPYTGPLPTGYSDRTPTIGDTVVVSGLRLANITSCTIDDIEVEISDLSATKFSIVIPEGLSPGNKNLVIRSASDKITAQGAFTVRAKPEIVSPHAVISKTNAGSFNGYVAVYAKGHKGKTLSWKIAGKWFKTTISSDYQVFQRKTAAVGLDVLVHLYIDGQKQLTKTVRTR